MIRELASGSETRIEHVSSYVLHESERWLAYVRSAADSLGVDGVYLRDLSTGTETALKVATGNYRALAFDEAGTQLAFITDADSWGAEKARYRQLVDAQFPIEQLPEMFGRFVAGELVKPLLAFS